MLKKVLLIDNYDSFTYNLFHYMQGYKNVEITVCRNDKISLDEIVNYDSLVLSPGPGLPKDAEKLLHIIARYHTTKKILGVCLGMQAIAEQQGGSLKNLSHPFHGVKTPIEILPAAAVLFKDLPKKISVGRYHSWVIDKMPNDFLVTAIDKQDNIMAIRHQTLPIFGVQFHPESILTDSGKTLLHNFLSL